MKNFFEDCSTISEESVMDNNVSKELSSVEKDSDLQGNTAETFPTSVHNYNTKENVVEDTIDINSGCMNITLTFNNKIAFKIKSESKYKILKTNYICKNHPSIYLEALKIK